MSRIAASIVVVLAVVYPLAAETPTRGIGIYPGDPAEDFSPSIVPAEPGRRNLALHRAATQSSAFDYDLVAQLVTDGIVETENPSWFLTSTHQDGVLPKHTRSFVLDDNPLSGIHFGEPGWIGFELGGGSAPPTFDRIQIGLKRTEWAPASIREELGIPELPPGGCSAGFVPSAPPPPGMEANEIDGDYAWSLAASDDGRTWTELGRVAEPIPGVAPPPVRGSGGKDLGNWFRTGSPVVWAAVDFDEPRSSRHYRVRIEDLDCKSWQVTAVEFYLGDERVRVGGPFRFHSAWKSAGIGEEWIAVDLGAEARVDSVGLHWLQPAAAGSLQVSNDGTSWRTVSELDGLGSEGGHEEVRIEPAIEARHVRVLMTRPAAVDGYILSELEVFGEGGVAAKAHPQPAPAEDGSLHLAGGSWRLQRESQVTGDGAAISTVGYADDAWIPATVPGTVLTSYYNVGALPDLNFGANEFNISDSFFHADFWYRNEIEGPELASGRRAFLEFDGVNWKAEVYFNGARLGRIEGAFMRGRFDVTEHLRAGTNAIAVRIEKPASPGATKQHTLDLAGFNGGAIGADNPSFHASIGWDWIPTIRGRNIGLWNDVHLTVSGPVTLDAPFLRYELPEPPARGDQKSADALLDVTLTNHGADAVTGTLRGTLGEVTFEHPVEIAGGSTETITLDPSTHDQLRLQNPKLWWPNGYGEPHLYDVELELVTEAGVSDTESFQTGVRQLSSSIEPLLDEAGEETDEKALRLFVNGRRVVPRGGNWGFSEANLRYRGREYDAAMRYHRDMNFTMARNWVGQIGDNEFYEAAARHGLLIWNDFWLANPYDGPDPYDEEMFMRNVRDTIRRIRNYPSIGLYCGRNEGDPPPTLDAAFAEAIAELHPEMHYEPNSQFGNVSGGGPYGLRTREYYFEQKATPKPHSELGMTSVVTLDSLKRMMPEASLWPMSLDWGLHDFNLISNQKAQDFVRTIEQGYGGADDLAEWVQIAQLVNYDGYRAMFEAQSKHRMGLQLWMSHPAWPSMTWQTYDYYFNPHASYFGSKKGSEPLHIQWNPLTDEVEVVNYGVDGGTGLTAAAQVLNLDGSVAWESSAALDSPYDSTLRPFELEFPDGLTSVHFIRLKLSRGDELVSENLYWRGTEPGNYRALRTLPDVPITMATRGARDGDRYVFQTEIENPSEWPVLGIRLVAVRAESGDPILPVLFSDNFVALMPGEKRTISTEVKVADVRGEEPRIVVEGFNVADIR